VNPYSRQLIDENDIQAVTEALQSSHLTQGKIHQEFEKEIASFTKSKYSLVFNSATSALHAAYKAVEISKDDEIITSPISFVATSNMAIVLGGKTVFSDIKLDGNIDERFIEKAITQKTKAIVPVHFAGTICNMQPILELAKKHNLHVIEDAAHALGSTLNDKHAGTFGDIGIFSFHAIKPITTGEGGAIVTNNEELYEKMKLFRSHGIIKKKLYDSDMIQMGYNYRLSDINAALGRSQLKKLPSFIEKREKIASYYNERFKRNRYFYTIDVAHTSSRHLYPILLKPEFQCSKEDVFSELLEHEIGVQVHYKPIYKNSFYTKLYGEQRLSVAEDFWRSELSIPCHQAMSLDDAKNVAEILEEILDKYSYKSCTR